MDWSWWPAAGAGSWEWAWRAYPGVWLFVLALAGGYVATLRALGPGLAPRGEAPASRRQLGFFALGLGALWLSLDWPLGALAAGYLLTFHALQYLLVSFGRRIEIAGPLARRMAYRRTGWSCCCAPFRKGIIYQITRAIQNLSSDRRAPEAEPSRAGHRAEWIVL